MGFVKWNAKPGQRELIIFGVRPSMVVDFEEACIRAGIAIRASVSPAIPNHFVKTVRKLGDLLTVIQQIQSR
jgi:hypothetical protein